MGRFDIFLNEKMLIWKLEMFSGEMFSKDARQKFYNWFHATWKAINSTKPCFIELVKQEIYLKIIILFFSYIKYIMWQYTCNLRIADSLHSFFKF